MVRDSKSVPRVGDDEPSDGEQQRYGEDADGSVVAEGRPDLSAADPEARSPTPGEDSPHHARMADDAEGAGGMGQPDLTERDRDIARNPRKHGTYG